MGDGSPDPRSFKIFPRNLTARADYVVRGNPANSRPESGVDNCFPGLEFDQRNLDRAFFPGFVFEFHRGDGAVLRSMADGGSGQRAGLAQTDLTPTLFLWAVKGRTVKIPPRADPPLQSFDGLFGLEVWRRVRDLGPGRVAILLGPAPSLRLQMPGAALDAMSQAYRSTKPAISRRRDGRLEWAVIVGRRARFVDPGSGVIDIDTYEPGDLTRSLCAPWQYDFRDCGCFYWAAMKPDLVASSDGTEPYLNFQRRDRRTSTADTPPRDIENWFSQRDEAELDYAELINGAWNSVLPAVLNDRESEQFVPAVSPPVRTLLSPAEVIADLKRLATVEHALSVEYLYAHYSLKAPSLLPPLEPGDLASVYALDAPVYPAGMSKRQIAIANAGQEILRIAVDEMRHLRWVNEALQLLGQPEPSLERASEIVVGQVSRKFTLEPLTFKRLEWFIEVEKPSQVTGTGLDGMYVQLYGSIINQPEKFPEQGRLIELIKLIIDEGNEHYRRFLVVREHLRGMQEKEFLRDLASPVRGSTLPGLQKVSDANYRLLIGLVGLTFRLGDRASGRVLDQARRAMFNLHDANHRLAARGVAPRFTRPTLPVVADTRTPREMRIALNAFLDDLASSSTKALEAFATDRGDRTLARRQRESTADLVLRTRELIEEVTRAL